MFFRICFFLTVASYLHAKDVLKENIPFFDEKASECISFCTTRALNDGALKRSLLEQFKAIFHVEAFVETGTCLGNTTEQAASIFKEIHTIELSQQLYLHVIERFKNRSHVKVYQGDSATLLEPILSNISKRTFIYLDGHYSGGVTAKGNANTPVLEELKAIKRANKGDSIILIDDLRLFQDSCYLEKVRSISTEDYPSLKELISSLLEINPRYQICALGDALLAFPKEDSITVSPVLSACTVHRLEESCKEFTEEDFRNADEMIAQAESEELSEMITYYNLYAPFELEYGYRSYSTLWYGLVLREQGRTLLAWSLFEEAAKNSQKGWRVNKILMKYGPIR